MSDIYIRLPDDLHAAVKDSAKRNHRSMTGEIAHAIDFYLKYANEAKTKEFTPTENKPEQ